jgi:hypothetical protein
MTFPTCLKRLLWRCACVVIVVSAASVGCDGEAPVVPAPSRAMFAGEVYPILLRDCGFAACHGDPARAFHLFGPGRLRLDPNTELLDPATEDELAASYERTRAMLLRPAGEDSMLLIRKPGPGGAHQGIDANGHNVYAEADDPALQVLAAWAEAGS